MSTAHILHTPGPWFAEESKLYANEHFIKTSRSQWLLSIRHNGEEMPDKQAANTRLVASAPDLLQELRNIANADTAEWDDRTEFEAWAKSRARTAIAKATGEAA